MQNNRNNTQMNARRRRPRQRLSPNTLVSHRDLVVQRRTFMNYNQLAFTNTEGDFSYGITSFNVSPKNNTYLGEVLSKYSKLYEQYRIARVVIKAQCGKGFTNDRRVKTILVSRVDVDNQATSQTFSTFRSLANASNAKTRTLTERGNVVLADFKPIMFDSVFTSNAVVPILPAELQWNRLVARDHHQWRGAVLGVAIPETNIQPDELKITLTQTIVVEFRGRINDADGINVSSEIVTLNPPTYDLTTDEDQLRTELLTGVWFPTNITHSIGNIGYTVGGADLVGNQFRVEATGDVYVVVAFGPNKALYCNLVV